MLIMGSGDVGNGGEGADVFGLGIWADADNPVVIEDYDAQEDAILIGYPSNYTGDLAVSVTSDPENSANSLVKVGGQTVAVIEGQTSVVDGGTVDPRTIVLAPVEVSS